MCSFLDSLNWYNHSVEQEPHFDSCFVGYYIYILSSQLCCSIISVKLVSGLSELYIKHSSVLPSSSYRYVHATYKLVTKSIIW